MNTKQISNLRMILLHLLPGLTGTVIYTAIAPYLLKSGFPSLFSFLIAAAGVIMPLELGYLLYQAQRANGSFSLKNIVLFRKKLSKWQYVVIPLILVIWGFLVTGATPLLDNQIAKSWFSWLPDWFYFFDVNQLESYSRPALLVTFWVGLIVNGLILPIVEELYFRGYLLPRIGHFGKWAPLINISLFSLYHFWTPWQTVSRILLLLPWVYTSWRKQNIYLMMIAHCTANTLGWLLIWGLILG